MSLTSAVLLIGFIYAGLDGVAAQTPPNWRCHVPYPCPPDARYGIPEDCTKFLICGGGGRHLFTLSCPARLNFDIVSDDCLYPDEATCQDFCNATTTESPTTQAPTTQLPTTTVTTEATTTGQVWPCNIPRPCKHLQYYGDPDDCTIIHLCYSNGDQIATFKCPGSLVYDTVSQDCINREDATCEAPCSTATTEGSGEMVTQAMRLDASRQRPKSVAFSVSLSLHDLHLNDGQTLVFDDLDLDSWYGYSQTRGGYVCPHEGIQIYQFIITVKFKTMKNNGKLEVMRNRKQTLATIMSSSDVTGSHVILTECSHWEEITVVCRGECHLLGNKETIFSGYMLK